ncbi:hypothetical protein CLAVI_001000 [Candidatus Clavichlamydia salmonicola]|uniref:hypothetical protein n=1 Tax=Candidatus Clavichlamydia salmonicola TaxID=469812 RepID=UPI001891465F|nr:hypothetical protein [Candidatus Clavichlamydia salmonicola]MBF5051357.1 hypothetical protein [Candidatus Clavichlamydia salmonicola]
MSYFTLNYVAPTLQNIIPYFTVTEEHTTLTPSIVASLYSLTHYILLNHLPCMSVPQSFPLDYTCHYNTILILQEALFPIITALRTTSFPPEGQLAIQALEKIFCYDLLQVDLTEFEQVLPIVTKGVALSNPPVTSHNSYDLPCIQISSNRKSFILTPYSVTDPLDYLQHLHQGVQHVLENRIFISDASTAPMVSASSLANYSLTSLLQLLIGQSKTISLVMDPLERQDVLQSNNFWINRLTLELQLAGFNDTSLTKISIPSKEQKSLTSTSSPIIKTSSKKMTYYIPIFSFKKAPAGTFKDPSKKHTIYLLEYIIKKSTISQYKCVFRTRTLLSLTLKSIQTICKNTKNNLVFFYYKNPFNHIIQTITYEEALQYAYIGLTENLTFFSRYFPNILKTTITYMPKEELDKILCTIKCTLGSNTPTIPQANTLEVLTQRATEPTTPLASKKIPELTSNRIPVFSVSTTQGREKKYSFLLKYSIRRTLTSKGQAYKNIRLAISKTEKHLKSLCNQAAKSTDYSIKYIDPFSLEECVVSFNEMLWISLQGLKENLIFLKRHFPIIFNATIQHNSEQTLLNSIQFIKNLLGSEASIEIQKPFILEGLLHKNLVNLE